MRTSLEHETKLIRDGSAVEVIQATIAQRRHANEIALAMADDLSKARAGIELIHFQFVQNGRSENFGLEITVTINQFGATAETDKLKATRVFTMGMIESIKYVTEVMRTEVQNTLRLSDVHTKSRQLQEAAERLKL